MEIIALVVSSIDEGIIVLSNNCYFESKPKPPDQESKYKFY
jgi:hypothetical protein